MNTGRSIKKILKINPTKNVNEQLQISLTSIAVVTC